MKPMILHSSKRVENEMNRRVIHIEFTDKELPNGLKWKEKINLENELVKIEQLFDELDITIENFAKYYSYKIIRHS